MLLLWQILPFKESMLCYKQPLSSKLDTQDMSWLVNYIKNMSKTVYISFLIECFLSFILAKIACLIIIDSFPLSFILLALNGLLGTMKTFSIKCSK